MKVIEKRVSQLERRAGRRRRPPSPELIEATKWMRWLDVDELDAYEKVLSRIVHDGREPTAQEAARMAAIERLGTDRMLSGERPEDELALEERSARWQEKYRRMYAELREQKAQEAAAGVINFDERRRLPR
jgi:hypothetical protein